MSHFVPVWGSHTGTKWDMVRGAESRPRGLGRGVWGAGSGTWGWDLGRVYFASSRPTISRMISFVPP